jgi:hypothetical protein
MNRRKMLAASIAVVSGIGVVNAAPVADPNWPPDALNFVSITCQYDGTQEDVFAVANCKFDRWDEETIKNSIKAAKKGNPDRINLIARVRTKEEQHRFGVLVRKYA